MTPTTRTSTRLTATLLAGQAVSSQWWGWSQCSHVSRHVTQSHVSPLGGRASVPGAGGADTGRSSRDTQGSSRSRAAED